MLMLGTHRVLYAATDETDNDGTGAMIKSKEEDNDDDDGNDDNNTNE